MMAHQNPKTGMFAYMIPLMSGTARNLLERVRRFLVLRRFGDREPFESMANPIWWHSGDHLIVNLFIPSTLDWKERNAKIELSTAYPLGEDVTFESQRSQTKASFLFRCGSHTGVRTQRSR